MRVVKIVLCGEGGVGKTSLAHRFTKGVFPRDIRLTVGIEHFTKVVKIAGENLKVVLWDLGGEYRFRFLAPVFLRGACGGVFVFDVTRVSTLYKLNEWLDIFRQYVGEVPSVLVGNKIDLKNLRNVDRERAEKYAVSRGFLGYYETSAKNNEGVDEPFIALLEAIVRYT
ncbi:MAG: hypothetical protein DRJ52_04295 [Thermoprotei archaeon]|nr:MAG: hypothetical protein DRJ52_04295 [Thermoprotei archaeon]RLF00786.1 MAG: hypothetical protein DRJ63_01370 [Thermoprotei archaeon]HDI74862.1 GTP-binding protein [Thermoprotei archaeon]